MTVNDSAHVGSVASIVFLISCTRVMRASPWFAMYCGRNVSMKSDRIEGVLDVQRDRGRKGAKALACGPTLLAVEIIVVRIEAEAVHRDAVADDLERRQRRWRWRPRLRRRRVRLQRRRRLHARRAQRAPNSCSTAARASYSGDPGMAAAKRRHTKGKSDLITKGADERPEKSCQAGLGVV